MEFTSVSDLTTKIKDLLEFEIKPLWIKGEVSRPKLYPSGHCYFTLKDDDSAISCVIWKSYVDNFAELPKEGDNFAVYGKVSVFKQRGQYQFTVFDGMPVGKGNIFLELEKLKKRLAEEGLFDENHKKEIPPFPKVIAIVTGTTTAALRDVIRVINAQKVSVKLLLFNTPVQGLNNYNKVIEALELTKEYSNNIEKIDLTLLVRGGGSIEDLWLFNNEKLARYIYDYDIPIITGIGHEIDTTLCDFVSDFRAATPSVAGEVSVSQYAKATDEFYTIESSFVKNFTYIFNQKRSEFDNLSKIFDINRVTQNINYKIQELDYIESEISNKVALYINKQKSKLDNLALKFEEFNPQNMLKKGYAYITDLDNKLIKSIKKLEINSKIKVVLQDGNVLTEVKDIEKRDI